jgi:integral membrane protein (TIGR01906 family)
VNSLGGRAVSVLVGIVTALVIVAIAIIPFLSPAWVGFEQDRAQAQAWTGYTTEELRTATNAILADLVLGPPDFDVTVAGALVLEAREQAHMRDVRNVFMALYVAAAIGVVVLAVAGWRVRDRSRLWRAVRNGATVLAVGVVVLGMVALVAFDSLFSIFHEVFFPAGSYTFDPLTERLVQLFPFQFWQETAIVVGVVIVTISALVAVIARRRERRSVAVDPGQAAAPVTVAG